MSKFLCLRYSVKNRSISSSVYFLISMLLFHAKVYGRTLVHELDIYYIHTDCNLPFRSIGIEFVLVGQCYLTLHYTIIIIICFITLTIFIYCLQLVCPNNAVNLATRKRLPSQSVLAAPDRSKVQSKYMYINRW